MKKIIVTFIVLLTGMVMSVAALPGYPYPVVWGTVLNVVDGNTIQVEIVSSTTGEWIPGSQEMVRYLGSYVDMADVSCWAVAAQVNYQVTFGRLVYLEFDEQLRAADGTLLAYVYLDGVGYSMVNAMLVAMGLTRATVETPNTRYENVFLGLEATAAQLGLGCLPR